MKTQLCHLWVTRHLSVTVYRAGIVRFSQGSGACMRSCRRCPAQGRSQMLHTWQFSPSVPSPEGYRALPSSGKGSERPNSNARSAPSAPVLVQSSGTVFSAHVKPSAFAQAVPAACSTGRHPYPAGSSPFCRPSSAPSSLRLGGSQRPSALSETRKLLCRSA